MPWDAACRGSMRSIAKSLIPVLVVFLILPVIMIPPQVSGSPDEIIPTRNILLLFDYPDDSPMPTANVSSDTVVTSKVSVSSANVTEPGNMIAMPIPAGFSASGSYIVSVAPTPVPTPSMARGWALVNFGTSIDSPEMMVEDRQRYMASGLFNVHVYHQFAG